VVLDFVLKVMFILETSYPCNEGESVEIT